MPAGAGAPRYEKLELWLGTANWHRGFCHAPPPPQRGTSPSPREVFDRTTFPSPRPSGFRLSPEWRYGRSVGFRGTIEAKQHYFHTNRSSRLAPAHQGMKIEALVGGIAVDILSRNASAWIPAFAGMTN